MKNYIRAVTSVPCPTCGRLSGENCLFNKISRAGQFHFKRLEVYRDTPAYKERVRKKISNMRLDLPKKKKILPSKKINFGVSANCKKGKHANCYNGYCTCPICNHDRIPGRSSKNTG